MKQILLIIICLNLQSVSAQTVFHKTSIPLKDKNGKFVKITVLGGSVYVEGYDGDDLIFEPKVPDLPKTSIEHTGMKDITALITQYVSPINSNFEITETESTLFLTFKQANHTSSVIKVPRNIHFGITLAGTLPDTKLSVKDMDGELEIGSYASVTEISNVSGPLVLNTSGINNEKQVKISNINWKKLIANKTKPKFWIFGGQSDVDISLPDDLKATIKITNNYGDVYSDLTLVPAKPILNTKKSLVAEMNGGGVPISIIEENGNVYIRKQK